MASNIFGRYIWLIDILRRYKRLTFEEINRLWVCSGLSYGEGDEIPIRTFHNHRNAIKDIFDVYIECDIKDGYKYYIDEPEKLQGDGLRSWLIDSYATLNQIQADKRLEGRILFEPTPSGNNWLTTFTNAIRNCNVVEITHQGFDKDYESTFEIEPYYLKIFKQRWYIIARNPYYAEKQSRAKTEGKEYKGKVFRVYALDRIREVEVTNKTFVMDENFSIEKFFDGSFGIIPSGEAVQHIVFNACCRQANYLSTLPIHKSQKEICSDDESTTFSLDIKPTYDFYQFILSQGSDIEILEPQAVRDEMRNFAENLLGIYK